MYLVHLYQHELLSRKILFKPVLNWLGEALATFGVTRMVIVPEGATPPREPGAKTIVMRKPMVFSPLLSGGHEHIQWPDGEALVPWGCLPVSTWEELLEARRVLQAAILHHHMENGVDIADPAGTFIGPDVRIGHGTTLLPGVVIQGAVTIGEGCEIGPYTHIRPDVTLGDETKAGAFVELKNTVWGKGTHAGHLCYVGDTDAGENVNFGCGTVTVNYDGVNKHRTIVGDNAFIGCNTNLVAPVTVGDGAYTAAGSTITEDVPPGSLAIARSRQVIKENWISPKAQKNGRNRQ